MGYRYIGSKSRIADDIINYIGNFFSADEYDFFIDAFSGTGVVAEKAANQGWPVYINDMLKSATFMSEARLLSKEEVKFEKIGDYSQVIELLNKVPGKKGFFWREYSPASTLYQKFERKYFSEENAMKIDAIKEKIHSWHNEGLVTNKEFSLLVSDLLKSINEIANIAGTYGCFLSHWTKQSENNLHLMKSQLREKTISYKKTNLDVFQIESSARDLVYLDPPYTKRQYASYYHIFETIAYGDMPVVAGVSGLRPWKEKSSVFCYKSKALSALINLILKQKARRVILSYSNEGHVKLDDLLDVLKDYGKVEVTELKIIGRYRPNHVAVQNNDKVREFLVDFSRENKDE